MRHQHLNRDFNLSPDLPAASVRANQPANRPGGKRISPGNRRGQTLLEFSFAMPLVLLVITGMVSFGIILHNYLVLTNGVNAGAQLLSMSRGQTSDPCATAATAVENAAPGLTAGSITFSYVIDGTNYSGTTCTSGAASMVQGTSAEVKATYPCAYMISGMPMTCSLASQTTEIIQ